MKRIMFDVRSRNPLRHGSKYVYIGVSAVQDVARKSEVEMIVSTLREKFVISAGDKLDGMGRLIAGIGTHDGSIKNHAHEIKSLAHALKGTAGSFGFMSITRIAEAFEEFLAASERAGALSAADTRRYFDAMRAIISDGNEPEEDEIIRILDALPSAAG